MILWKFPWRRGEINKAMYKGHELVDPRAVGATINFGVFIISRGLWATISSVPKIVGGTTNENAQPICQVGITSYFPFSIFFFSAFLYFFKKEKN